MACKIDLLFANGDKMPAVGLGTWRAPDAEVELAINAALEAGANEEKTIEKSI
jgi:diketogulonate reductase-like aldo/keto reductase